MTTITRDDFNKLFTATKLAAEQIDAAWETYLAEMEQLQRIEDAGLEVHYRKHLLRVSNTRWSHGGTRLQDGTGHYQHQVTVSGRTYNIKDDLKAAGFRWDAGDKVWHRAMTTKGASVADHLSVARNEIDAILAD